MRGASERERASLRRLPRESTLKRTKLVRLFLQCSTTGRERSRSKSCLPWVFHLVCATTSNLWLCAEWKLQFCQPPSLSPLVCCLCLARLKVRICVRPNGAKAVGAHFTNKIENFPPPESSRIPDSLADCLTHCHSW